MPNLGILLVFLFGFVCKSNCQKVFIGRCPQVEVIDSFDLNKYMGTWYEYSKYSIRSKSGLKCQQVVYNAEGNDSFAILNTGIIKGSNKTRSITATAKVIEPGQLSLTLTNQTTDTDNNLILGTDYDNFTVVYKCRNKGLFNHSILLWILTRLRKPSKKTLAAAKEIINKNDLLYSIMKKTPQDNCPDENNKENGTSTDPTDYPVTAADSTNSSVTTTESEDYPVASNDSSVTTTDSTDSSVTSAGYTDSPVTSAGQ